MAPNDASVRAFNRLTDMKHLKAAFFPYGVGPLSSDVLRGKLYRVGVTAQPGDFIHPPGLSQLIPPHPTRAQPQPQCQNANRPLFLQVREEW